MKQLIQHLFRKAGFDLRRLPEANEVVFPYVETFERGEIRFRYWITDPYYREWYNPTVQAHWHETRGYLDLVQPGDRILEVGCNNGFTMCLLKSISGVEALFVGLDVIPLNCQIAMSQIALNTLSNCHVLNLGGSDSRGTVKVFNTNNGFVAHNDTRNTIEIETIPCDELEEQYGAFDLLKIDVEGFESRVLKGARKILARKPKLILELHDTEIKRHGSSYEEVFALIGIEDYEGSMCLRTDNELRPLEPSLLLARRPHATLFIRPKRTAEEHETTDVQQEATVSTTNG